jgi:hypothetical protein
VLIMHSLNILRVSTTYNYAIFRYSYSLHFSPMWWNHCWAVQLIRAEFCIVTSYYCTYGLLITTSSQFSL